MIINWNGGCEEILDPSQIYWCYNALDCLVTAEVHENVTLNNRQSNIYEFERCLQASAFAMQIRGIRVDPVVKEEVLKMLEAEAGELRDKINAKVSELGGSPFKYLKGWPPSTHQLQRFFYDEMGLRPYYKPRTRKRTCDKDALKKLSKREVKSSLGVVADHALGLRDRQMLYQVLKMGVSPDGRFRATFAVGQTETGRPSSYKDAFGHGDNLQNKDKRIRHMFVPDEGWIFINPDLEQAESRCIAYLAEDERYIAAHEEGNVHVASAKVFWPDLGFSNDDAENKERLAYLPASWVPQPTPKKGEKPAFSYYDMSKRGQHGLNYGLQYHGLATWIGSTQSQARDMRGRYFDKYPYIETYHRWVANEIRERGYLVTPFGMQRQFFGRAWDNATVREAIAHVPQSMVAYIGQIGIHNVWEKYDPGTVQVLQNGFDSMLAQIKRVHPSTLLDDIRSCMEVDVDVHGRNLAIPVDMGELGENWRDCG